MNRKLIDDASGLLKTVPNYPVEQFVHVARRFFRAAIDPPPQKR